MCYSYISEFDTISHTVVCIAELCGVLTVECVMCVGCVCSCTSLRRLARTFVMKQCLSFLTYTDVVQLGIYSPSGAMDSALDF